MRYNQLGNTGMFVSEICLGTMTFGPSGKAGTHWGAIAGVEQEAADAIVARSLAAGVNFFDTADVYSVGASEQILGQSIRNLGVRRQDVVIATKTYGAMGAGPNERGASRGHIMDSVEGSLQRLQTDHIDLYQIHGTDPVTPIDETLRALDDLVSRGLVRYVGASNWQAWRIAKALGISDRRGFARLETVQSYYSIAGRDLEREIVPLLNEERLGLMVWSPMAGGLLSGKYGPGAPGNGEGRRANFNFPPVDEDRAWAAVAVMRKIAEKHDCQRRHRRARLGAGQAIRDERHHRRQPHGAARSEPCGHKAQARRSRHGTARRGQRSAVRISGMDARSSGGRPPSGTLRAEGLIRAISLADARWPRGNIGRRCRLGLSRARAAEFAERPHAEGDVGAPC